MTACIHCNKEVPWCNSFICSEPFRKFVMAWRRSLIRCSQMAERTTLCLWMVFYAFRLEKVLCGVFLKEGYVFCTMVQTGDWKGRKRQRSLWATVEHKKSLVTGRRNWKLSIKVCADLNRYRFLFQCRVYNNKMELTGVLFLQSYSSNIKIEMVDYSRALVLKLWCLTFL